MSSQRKLNLMFEKNGLHIQLDPRILINNLQIENFSFLGHIQNSFVILLCFRFFFTSLV